MQNRFKSKVLWAAILGQLVSILQLAGVFESIGINAGQAGDAIAWALQGLTMFGVLNDPTNKTGF